MRARWSITQVLGTEAGLQGAATIRAASAPAPAARSARITNVEALLWQRPRTIATVGFGASLLLFDLVTPQPLSPASQTALTVGRTAASKAGGRTASAEP